MMRLLTNARSARPLPSGKKRLSNFYHLEPHYYIVKLGFAGVFEISLFLKHRLWVLVLIASLRRFKRVPIIDILNRNKKNIKLDHQIFINAFE